MGGNGNSSNGCTRVGSRGGGIKLLRWGGTRDGTRVGNRGVLGVVLGSVLWVVIGEVLGVLLGFVN